MALPVKEASDIVLFDCNFAINAIESIECARMLLLAQAFQQARGWATVTRAAVWQIGLKLFHFD